MASWQNLTSDPNSQPAHRYRDAQLAKAHRDPVDDRNPMLVDLARGKRVLDVGCVNHTTDAYQDPAWLHGQIVKAASYCLGVDVLEEGVAHLRAAGFNAFLIGESLMRQANPELALTRLLSAPVAPAEVSA